ncbi:N-6 DNA methylase [Coraliomargarita sp. SDUM461003]|uniref:site-specific DNA-methyltransferase (adenine-specific) n=1 Tax=Thalassobacterium maritimum TaxID=3041265 RepID=A0ABU1ASE4_9BACT|nr:N-6 DNA methylase [Coraliomargarita sp. SDUM461003]MDQ8205897.1 N-6 DNA methylase [Coraliomargarita sp. SDUM461003]
MSKITGAYYTPSHISDFMVSYLSDFINSSCNAILEPSVGDGSFLRALSESNSCSTERVDLTIVELDSEAIESAYAIAAGRNAFRSVVKHNGDFLAYEPAPGNTYSLVLGNPPYIKKKFLDEEVLGRVKECHAKAGLGLTNVSNIWTAFVLKSAELLDEHGVLALVLPADLLQVKYAEKLRVFLEERFQRLEIFVLSIRDFTGIEQQTLLLFAYKIHDSAGTFFYEVEDFEASRIREISSNGLMISQSKWTHYTLSSAEIGLLNRINERLPRASDFITSRPGVVTGANDFFILNEQEIAKHGAMAYKVPILTRSSSLTCGGDFTAKMFDEIVRDGVPSYLLDLNKKNRPNSRLDDYLRHGVDLELHERYKCKKRNRWYNVPGVSEPADALIFKRIHSMPKLVRNLARVQVTDSAYLVNVRHGVDVRSFIASFYNIITLIFTELMGRRYGGGVLELTPSEFQSLPMLYRHFKAKDYHRLCGQVEFSRAGATSPHNIDFYDGLGLSAREYESLQNIYLKLKAVRLPELLVKSKG